MKADAIVNTANPHVKVGAGVDSAIYAVAGYDQLLKARSKIGELRPGEVGLTSAFALPARFIIHVCGLRWEGGEKGEAEILRRCYDQALHMAYEKKCHSIAFPLLSTGCYRFPKKLALQIALDAFTAFLEDHEMEITLVVFGSEAVRVSGNLVDQVKAYIDDLEVRKAYREEYQEEYREEYQKGYLGDDSETDQEEHFTECLVGGPQASLEDILKGIYTESFGKHLQSLLNKKCLKNSTVYAAANISKQYFSKLLKDQVKPSKEKMLALAVGLRLNLDETVDFLQLAGYALSPI